jgi:hypothetical protein
VIPGERRSTRVAARDVSEEEEDADLSGDEIVAEGKAGDGHAGLNGNGIENGEGTDEPSISNGGSGMTSAAASDYNGRREQSMDVDDP